ncbi:hypothetical protein GM418_23345 [Maribellus comscasis]|uniref:Uncharacterized protein n=1 Tax=Maribellus comscasis TaxID=2681766 RepID=A0A6I6JYT1_9BACT|nr:hypothetical protein [Maribellus comscasis]QGY46489.1 hypothetical protein GM418_23345 [Maribellus comscasis]
METIIKKSGLLIFRFNRKLRWIFNIRILQNHNTTILFILIVCLLILLFGLWGMGFSFIHVILYSAISITILFLTLLFVGSLNEARRLSKQVPSSCFQFVKSNLNGIYLPDLGFTENDRENINLVLNGLETKSRIDFKLVSDNRAAADYKKLFRILHLLIDGGIKDFKKERKEQLFKLIESTFTLNGSDVNRASLNSRFSEWANENESNFSENLNEFQKILNL